MLCVLFESPSGPNVQLTAESGSGPTGWSDPTYCVFVTHGTRPFFIHLVAEPED